MIKIMHGNVLDKLKILENESINCVVTSPPYWRLRDYNHSDQFGLEETPEQFIENFVMFLMKYIECLEKMELYLLILEIVILEVIPFLQRGEEVFIKMKRMKF